MEEKEEELVPIIYRDTQEKKDRIFARAKKKKMSVTKLIDLVMETYLDSQDRLDTPKKRF